MATFTTWQPHNDLSDSRLKSHHPSRKARVVKRVAPPLSFPRNDTSRYVFLSFNPDERRVAFSYLRFLDWETNCAKIETRSSPASDALKSENLITRTTYQTHRLFFFFLFTWYDPAQFRLINMLGGAAALRLITLCAYLHAVRQRSAPIKSNGILQMFGITKVTICIIYCHVGKSCAFGSPDVLLHSPCFL